MYNTNMKCTYMDIKEDEFNIGYQTELLLAFNLSEYSDQLTTKIEKLYNYLTIHYLKLPEIMACIHNFSTDSTMLFMYLFSHDYFSYTHSLLVDIFTKKDTTQSHNLLVSILSK
jgi:hypothetical protein